MSCHIWIHISYSNNEIQVRTYYSKGTFLRTKEEVSLLCSLQENIIQRIRGHNRIIQHANHSFPSRFLIREYSVETCRWFHSKGFPGIAIQRFRIALLIRFAQSNRMCSSRQRNSCVPLGFFLTKPGTLRWCAAQDNETCSVQFQLTPLVRESTVLNSTVRTAILLLYLFSNLWLGSLNLY